MRGPQAQGRGRIDASLLAAYITFLYLRSFFTTLFSGKHSTPLAVDRRANVTYYTTSSLVHHALVPAQLLLRRCSVERN